MAADEEALRDRVIRAAIGNVPRAFLEELHSRAQRAYPDVFAAVAADPTCLPEQQIDKLLQDRHFRMEWELLEAAKAHGLVSTARQITENKRKHAFVSAGTFALTQAYVQAMGDLPQPAKYRDSLAAAARCPRLPLDDPSEIYRMRDFYALLANNPVGRRFTEEDQQLGTLSFCVPYRDMKGWAVEMTVLELLAAYPTKMKPVRKDRAPTWKSQPEIKKTK
jgi:hypothetical protein